MGHCSPCFRTPLTGDNGKAIVSTDSGEEGEGTEGVVRLEVDGRGTSALDHIVFRFDGEITAIAQQLQAGGLDQDAEKSSLLSGEDVVTSFALDPAYPNPFNPVTTIGYALPHEAKVSLVVYDILGREVEVLVDGFKDAGRHSVQFDAANLPSGTYFYRLVTPEGHFGGKMILLK